MVRVANEVYFSPSRIFGVIDFDYSPPDEIIDSFKERTNGFFLEQARYLLVNSPFGSIAAGLILMATIDYLARYRWIIKYGDKEPRNLVRRRLDHPP